MKKIIYLAIVTFSLLLTFSCSHPVKVYKEISRPTKKIGDGVNDVQGIILHHTAEEDINGTLSSLCNSKREASSHIVIDKDGTRYILAKPEAITWHAGYSILNGREKCNDFTVGIEFQGNTKKYPLTEDQIQSAIDYVIPLMTKYNIPIENIVTHEKIRRDWIIKHPDLAKEKGVKEKVDITQVEYERFINMLKKRLEKTSK